MTLKKKEFAADEFPIYDDAVIFMRGEFWQFRMWLAKEHKYARFSLKTRNKTIAVEKAKLHYHELKTLEIAGKTYYSKTIKQGVELYLAQRQKEVDSGVGIKKGRWGTIRTHLNHFLDFIGRDTKLKELHRMDCENYYLSRNKMKKSVNVSITTIANEQSTINALINWLYKHSETYIDAFEFPAFKKIDRGDEELRRSIFDEEEIWHVRKALEDYVNEAKRNLDDRANLSKFVTGLYLLISSITGMRRGEQMQLIWNYVEFKTKPIKGAAEEDAMNLVRIHIPFNITKWEKTRNIYVNDNEYFLTLQDVLMRRYIKEKSSLKGFGETFVFSLNFERMLTPRAISYHFDKILEIADIKNIEKRNLVPYSFRHSFITHMINNGADERAVADMSGTSRLQIEKTYYHVTEKRMIENSMPNLRYEDGMLILPDSMKRKL
jgi:site-specific recombinase XerD